VAKGSEGHHTVHARTVHRYMDAGGVQVQLLAAMAEELLWCRPAGRYASFSSLLLQLDRRGPEEVNGLLSPVPRQDSQTRKRGLEDLNSPVLFFNWTKSIKEPTSPTHSSLLRQLSRKAMTCVVRDMISPP
jgi:hypothetical protein